MLILLASPLGLCKSEDIYQDAIDTFRSIKSEGHAVGVVSNHSEPDWFEEAFSGSEVQFFCVRGRQNGEFIANNAKRLKMDAHDVLVLAATQDDMQMGKNGGAILVASGWSGEKLVEKLGVYVDSAAELQEVVRLSSAWSGGWYFSADGAFYSVRSLGNLSGVNVGEAQQKFAKRLTQTVKQAGPELNSLLVVTARSLLADGVAEEAQVAWGVFPSSERTDTDSEVLSDFTHRLRTTTSKVRFAKRDEPLFIRHTKSAKRSRTKNIDRTDPSNQIETVHLNPFYKKQGRLKGKHVFVVDDCTTYGVSFAVAAALLKKAGARKVTGVALGKFGNQLREYDIEINSNPYEPISHGSYTVEARTHFNGQTSAAAQDILRQLLVK